MKIVFIGAGNLAFHLSQALRKAGYEIVQVYSRTEKSAKALAELIQATHTSDIESVHSDAELYVISVSDDAIARIASLLPATSGLVVHTAGSVPMDVFAPKFDNHGVFYPLQTFSKARPVSFAELPVFIESNTPENLQILRSVASALSRRVYEAHCEERLKVHLAAVFGCNFANHLFHLSSELCRRAGFEFSVLSPLLLETVNKALASESPKSAQTGPAVRNDAEVMGKHLSRLEPYPEMREIYALLSKNILKTKNEQA